MRHEIHPKADEELAAAVDYFKAIDRELGLRFYAEMERLIREVCADPERFRQFDPPARRHFSHSFPFAVIYILQPDHVWIVAIMNLKKRPGYWKKRIR